MKTMKCEVVKKVKHLGIELTMKNIDLYKNNYEKLVSDKDMLKWKNWNPSLMGQISVVIMNILPRIMFLFQTIPVVKYMKQFVKWFCLGR